MTGTIRVLAMAVIVVASVLVPAHGAAAASSHGDAYLTKVLDVFLGRSPTSAEFAQNAATSMTTEQGRLRLADNVTTSGEWYFVTVADRYRRVLGRNPDLAGLAYWVNSLASRHVTTDQLMVLLYASSEYASGLTVEGWVQRLYGDLIDRSPDPVGLAYWASVTRRRGRGSVARAFYRSGEVSDARVTADYRRVLGRAPDPGGLAYWSGVEARLGEVPTLVRLVATSEAYGPLEPGEIVTPPPPRPLAAQLAHNGLTTRVVTVRSGGWSSTTAELIAWERTVIGWRIVMGPYAAHVGARGWDRPTQRREGNGTTPTGRYAFASGFGLATNPGYRLGWFVVDDHDYWTSDPYRSDYNTHQRGPSDPSDAPWRNAEHLIDHPVAYRYVAVIDFNAPPTGPYGSAIFLHVSTGGPTAGCVSLYRSALVRLLEWIDAGTRIVMGPDSVIRSY